MQRTELIAILKEPLIRAGYSGEEALETLGPLSTQELHNRYYSAVQRGEIRGRVGDGYGTPTSAPGPTAEQPSQPPPPPKATWADVEQVKQEARAKLQAQQIEFETQRALDDEAWIMEQEKRNAPQREAQRKEDLVHDKSVFQDAARVLRSFAVNEANLNVLRSALGPGNLSVYEIQKAIQTGKVNLTGPTDEQLTEYYRGDVEQHNQELVNSSSAELRIRVRQEAEARRQQTAVEETQAADQARQARDAGRNFPPLPDTRNGKPLNSTYIKRASRDELKFLIQKFGPDAVTSRLRGTDGVFSR